MKKKQKPEYGLAIVYTSIAYPKPWIGQVIPLGKKGACSPAMYRQHKRLLQEQINKAIGFWASSGKIINVKITEVK